jgi:hypothetical protein
VIEAAERSGTPGHRPARQQPQPPADGRPGPVTCATSGGRNALICDQRAACVTSAAGIIAFTLS